GGAARDTRQRDQPPVGNRDPPGAQDGHVAGPASLHGCSGVRAKCDGHGHGLDAKALTRATRQTTRQRLAIRRAVFVLSPGAVRDDQSAVWPVTRFLWNQGITARQKLRIQPPQPTIQGLAENPKELLLRADEVVTYLHAILIPLAK